MKSKKEGEVMELSQQEPETAKEFVFPDPCVYCGPSVKGVAKQYTVYTGGLVPKPLRDFVRQYPAVKGLIVPVGRFAKVRERLEQKGTPEAILYQTVRSKL